MLAPGPACNAFDRIQNFQIRRLTIPISRRPLARLAQTAVFGVVGLLLVLGRRTDCVIFGHWFLALAGPILLRPLGIPYWVILHGGELAPYLQRPLILRITLACLRRATGLIVNSEFTRRQYRDLGLVNTPLVVITPGVDAARFFREATDADAVLARWKLKGKRIILTVATLVERKGHDVVLRALRRVLQRFPDAHYLIVGAGPNECALRRLAADSCLTEHVTFAGRISDEELPAYYQVCDLFVMPSRLVPGSSSGIEGFGIVYLEASAAGKPVIAGAGSGAEEAVAAGVSGLIVDPESVEAVADAIETLLADPRKAESLGRGGKARATDGFSLASRAERLMGALTSSVRVTKDA